MSRLNHRKLLAEWDTIIMRLCEEVTTHDVLGVIDEYLGLVAGDLKRLKRDGSRVAQCRKHIQEARKAIDPES